MTENQYTKTSSSFSSEATPPRPEASASLTTIYKEWRELKGKKEGQEAKKTPASKAKASSSASSSSGSDSDSSEDAKDSDVEMEDAVLLSVIILPQLHAD